jgi:hypothetical protein
MPLNKTERRALMLRQWAMRCADKINGVVPARAGHLGNLYDFGAEFGFVPRTWETAYGHILATMKAEGVE